MVFVMGSLTDVQQGVLSALEEHREVLRSVLPKFNGRMIGEIGDATLSSLYFGPRLRRDPKLYLGIICQ